MENGFTDDEDGKQLWSHILEEVQTNAQLKQPGQRCSLLMLGDIGSGKTALVGRLLRGNDDNLRRGHGLEYHCLEVTAADYAAAGGEGSGVNGPASMDGSDNRLGVWTLDGDPRHQNLLRFALIKASYQHTLAVLVGSVEAPWALLDSLQQWADILNRHVDRLGLDPDEVNEARESLVRHFLDYTEPEVEGSADGPPDGSGASAAAVAATSPLQQDPSSHLIRRTNAKRANPLHPPADPEKVALPLPDGVLTNNSGLPLVVVITKADLMSTSLERDFGYKEEQFDYLQYHLRMFCLKYGAALVYTSAREDRNCTLLRQYLLHRVYDLPCSQPAYVLERDCVFVPAGWDSAAKAGLLLAGGPAASLADSPYHEVLTKPVGAAAAASLASNSNPTQQQQRRAGAGDEAEQLAEDEQVFLCRLQACLSKAAPAPGGGGGGGAGVSSAAMGAAGSAAARGGIPANANDGVLATFFNSLLTKKGPAGGGGGGGSAGAAAGNPGSAEAVKVATSASPATATQQS